MTEGFAILEIIAKMLSYPFIVRALIVGPLISLCAALLGVSLVLKRYSMIGDGLSHAGFGALAIAAALNLSPLTVSIPVVVAAAFLLLRISENSKLRGDAAIALISTSSLAVGVVIISRSGGNTDLSSYLFGSILAMNENDVWISAALSLVVLFLFVIFYNKIFAVTFDEVFAKATGVNTGVYNALIALLTAVTIVLGMRLMGSLLISSLIIFPALTSMRLCKTFRSVIICSAVLSEVCFFAGITVSYLYETPAGASVVLANLSALLLFSAVSSLQGILARHAKTIISATEVSS